MKLNDQFPKGNIIVYELKNNTGYKYTCIVTVIENGWIKDKDHGTFLSNSFRPEDVIIWENKGK
jgi:hypothetical protein